VYAVEVDSALDALLMPLKIHTEKTYSAPMAVRLFAKESVEGEVGRDFPRLRYGGAELGDDLGRYPADVFGRIARGLGVGVVLWAAFWMLFLPLRRRHADVAWNAVLAALFALCLFAGPVAALAEQYHVLGTDKVGQDVLYLALKSIRTGLLIGTLTTLIMLPAAVLLGILAGYMGGWVDDFIQYLYTTLNSIPGVLLIAAAVLMMQVVIDNHADWFPTAAERADARLLALCAILGVTSWTGLCRLLRGEALKLRETDYVQAARAFGVSRLAVMLRHILPNVMHIVLISLVMDFSSLVLAEAVLSYVGVGVDPNTISFGTMINAARMELAREPVVWWSLAAAFGFMFVLVLAANLFADAVRDAFDPRQVK
jgi:peptide/nickel transport system permease protein